MIYAYLATAITFWAFIACAGRLRDSQDGHDACDPMPSMGEPVADDDILARHGIDKPAWADDKVTP